MWGSLGRVSFGPGHPSRLFYPLSNNGFYSLSRRPALSMKGMRWSVYFSSEAPFIQEPQLRLFSLEKSLPEKAVQVRRRKGRALNSMGPASGKVHSIGPPLSARDEGGPAG